MSGSAAKKAACQLLSLIRPLFHHRLRRRSPFPVGEGWGQSRVAFLIEICYTAFTDVFSDFLGKRQFFKGSTA